MITSCDFTQRSRRIGVASHSRGVCGGSGTVARDPNKMTQRCHVSRGGREASGKDAALRKDAAHRQDVSFARCRPPRETLSLRALLRALGSRGTYFRGALHRMVAGAIRHGASRRSSGNATQKIS